ncbi:NUDIX domain-containing protein [Bdellovibrio sp. HCB337]|uniref:NUDIX domain-containing protein n=1 Tax=Bdellovibrio sp. HCB337 TaxID=3394358 RepID=UPI0039A509F4
MSTKPLLPEAEYLATLPKKRMGVGVVFTSGNKVLVLKPTYKDHWLLPGGVIDENESPREAAIREVKEELGLDVVIEKLIVMDYLHPAGTRTECIQFFFQGPELKPAEVAAIQLQSEEITEYEFVEFPEALKRLGGHASQRLKIAISKNFEMTYLENGQEI